MFYYTVYKKSEERSLTIFGAHLRIIGEVVLLYLITPVLLLKTQPHKLIHSHILLALVLSELIFGLGVIARSYLQSV